MLLCCSFRTNCALEEHSVGCRYLQVQRTRYCKKQKIENQVKSLGSLKPEFDNIIIHGYNLAYSIYEPIVI